MSGPLPTNSSRGQDTPLYAVVHQRPQTAGPYAQWVGTLPESMENLRRGAYESPYKGPSGKRPKLVLRSSEDEGDTSLFDSFAFKPVIANSGVGGPPTFPSHELLKNPGVFTSFSLDPSFLQLLKPLHWLDRIILCAENVFSLLAIVPVLGTFPSVGKCGLGVAQIVAGLACGVFFYLKENPSTYRWAFSHVKHGCGNVLAAGVESIPLVSIALLIARIGLMIYRNDYSFPGNGLKFTPYQAY